jgi:hypothetical protein
MRPAVPLYWRCTPTECTPFFTSPVSSIYADILSGVDDLDIAFLQVDRLQTRP